MEKIITPAEKEYLFFKDCWAECTVPCTHEVEEPTELMLEMPDGVRLRTVCYRPKTEQKKIPVVFQRCCYPNKEKTLRMHAEEFCKRGIAVVFQFCRGKGGSEGVWVPQTMNERTDGMALIQYLESLDWVGPMGYWGSSYMALCGLVLLEGLSDSVKTMYLTHYGTDRYMSVYESGLFRQDLYTGWSRENMGVPTQVGHLESCVYRPQVSLDTDLWGTRLDWYREWVTSTQPGDRCWNSGLWNYLRRAPSVTKIPIYYGASWFDIHCGGAMHAYENLAEESKEQSTFRIGAWEHGFYPCMRGHKQEHLENNNAVQALNWFMDILLEGKPAKKKVELYMIGADEWSSYDTYPLPEDKQMVLYLSDKASSPEAGTLSEDCEAVTVVALGQQEGSFCSQLLRYRLSETQMDAETTLPGHLTLDIGNMATCCASVSDNEVTFVDAEGEVSGSFTYGGLYLRDYALSDGDFAALLLNRYRSGSIGTLVSVDGEGKAVAMLDITEEVMDISAAGEYLAVLYNDSMAIYNRALEQQALVEETGYADSILMNEDGTALIIGGNTAWRYLP